MGFGLNPLRGPSSELHTGERVVGDGTKDFKSAMKTAVTAVRNMSPSDIGHASLDVVGMVPVVGTPVSLANAAWYLAQGKYTDAVLAAAGAIPFEGAAANALKLGRTAARLGETTAKLGEDASKAAKIAKDGEAAAKLGKGAEKLGEEAAADGVKTGNGAVKVGEGAAAKPEAGAVSSAGAETKPSGPRIHSRYADNRPVYEGQQPPRIKGPDPAAQGNAHSVLRHDPVNGRTYQAREFDGAGHPARDVDFTNPTYPNGTVRPGHPGPPHQHRFVVNNPNAGPRSGFKRGGPEPMP